MSGTTGRYDEYRDSGLPWLGKIPAHWEVRRNGRLFAERREVADPELPLLEVSIRTGVRVRQLGDGGRKQVMTDRSKYQRARAGDIAYNMMRMWQGAVGVVPTDGLVSPAYVVAKPYEDVEPRYYTYLFRTAAYLQQVAIESRGIVPDRNRLYWDAFKAMPSVYPPVEEQKTIASFLDAHARQVARFRRTKQRLMALLGEREELVIRRIVLGKDTAAPRTPVDGAWYDELPVGWAAAKLRTVVTVRGGMTPTKSEESYWTGAIPWVSPKDMKLTVLRDAEDHISEAAVRETGIPHVPCPSVLMVVRGMILARDVPFAITEVPVTINQDMKALTPQPGVDAKFLYYVLRAAKQHLKNRVEIAGHGTRKLPTSAWRDLSIPLPSSAKQKAIVGRIERQLEDEARLLAAERSAVSRVEELSARLTAHVVSGHFDARHMTMAAEVARTDVGEGFDKIEEDEEDAEELVVSDAD